MQAIQRVRKVLQVLAALVCVVAVYDSAIFIFLLLDGPVCCFLVKEAFY